MAGSNPTALRWLRALAARNGVQEERLRQPQWPAAVPRPCDGFAHRPLATASKKNGCDSPGGQQQSYGLAIGSGLVLCLGGLNLRFRGLNVKEVKDLLSDNKSEVNHLRRIVHACEPDMADLLAIPNTNMKVSSEDVPTFIQPQKDFTAFRKLNIDHNDDEDKGHWTEETLEQMNTRDWSFAGGLLSFIPSGRVPNPM